MNTISEHFTINEVDCNCGCGGIIIEPLLVQCLEILRSVIGHGVNINSWYRCQEHNDAVGGTRKSQHRLGKAVDVWCEGLTSYHIATIAKHIKPFNNGGVIIYDNFVHLDIRGVRYHDDRRTT